MSYGPSSTLSLAYVGVNVPTPPNVTLSNRAPASTDWHNQIIGNLWIDQIGENAYILVSLANNSAVWNLAAATSGSLATLTGNSGGAVGATADNINIVGDGTTVDIVGNPGTSTLTVTAMGVVPISFHTDSGNATPAAGVIDIAGGTNINTSGAGNTVTVNLDANVVATSFSTATQAPITDSLLISGNTVQAAGTGTDVGVNITSKGNGSLVSTTNAVTTTQGPDGFEVDTTAAAGAGSFTVLGQNTQISLGANNITLETTASTGNINLEANGTSTLVTISAAQAQYTFFGPGSGTSALSTFQNSNAINTTNATPTTIITSGTIAAGNIVSLKYVVQAVDTTTGTDSLFAEVFANAAYYTGAGSLVLIGSPVISINTTNPSATVTAAVVANALVIQVTGIAAQTWEWTAIGFKYISSI